MVTYEIGEEIRFFVNGVMVIGEVQCRNWSFDTLLSYIVGYHGVRYNVNANSFEAGHSF